MQLFSCPFCGPRDEREFRFLGEAGKTRPKTETNVPDRDWSDYLYSQRNDKGAVREIWMHLSCAELFLMERDSVTMDVKQSASLREPIS